MTALVAVLAALATLPSPSIQERIDAAAAGGGGVVRIGPGEIETGPIVMKSGVTLELAKGTTLLASTNLADYAATHAFVYAEGAENFAIVGEGTFCGRGWAFREKEGLPGESQPSELVPVLMRFSGCRGVRLEGFTFRDGAAWGMHLRSCDGVLVRRVKAFNHVNCMNDGIDIESRNVLVEDCDLDTDDDAVVFKSESDPSFAITNVEVRNCRLASCCNAIKFGTGSYGLWRDIDVHDCVLERAAKTWRFDWSKPSREHPFPSDAFPKPMPGVTNSVTGLAAIALEVVDGGRMENVKVRNIDIRSGFQTPIFIRMARRHPPASDLPTCMRDVLVENVSGTAESRIACSITGLPYARPTGITLRNVNLRFPGGGTSEEASRTPRECETDYPDNYMFDQEALPAWGLYVRHVDNLRLENVSLSLLSPDARPMIVKEDVKDFSWSDPPAAPGFESWGFRRDLAEPEPSPPPAVGGDGREPWLKTRISRCFFSPIKRPPLNRDELMDDVDYYPEPYLERLAREGVNALWLTIRWRELAETSFTKRHPDAGRRLEKLRRTVDRCLKHGIKTYAFFIEPIFAVEGDQLLKEHPELFGEPCEGMRVMCASRPEVRRYIEESVRDIFTQVPRLGGTISISHGERSTTCFSWVDAVDGTRRGNCPLCSSQEPWQMHNHLAGSIVRGIRAAGSDAVNISWFYQPYVASKRAAWVAECARHLPDGVVLQYNFESGAVREQLGGLRHGGDYWLSYTGPSDAFRAVAEAARGTGARIGAKIQVCNSHEMATVPYVPVPGLLYRKYREMRRLGVSTVMQCWYFGSYPGVMNRAAGELAYEDFSDGEDAFLRRLAAPYWGNDAETVAKIWKKLSDAYGEYPLSNNMQYYGPFAAGVAWPLRPDIDLAQLARTWKPFDLPSGDLIGECLENHTLDEALRLTARMVELSQVPEIDALEARWRNDRERMLDLGVMKALSLHFRSAYDIFDFYAARAEAVFASRSEGDTAKALKAIDRMSAAVVREEEVSREFLPLVKADSRLGFHSEAEVHLYHPARIEWRLGKLAEAKRRIAEIRAVVAGGGGYPESSFERAAPSLKVGGGWFGGGGYGIKAEAAADGGLAVSVRTPDRRPIRVSTLDALGLSVYRTLTFDADGKVYDMTINRIAPNHVVDGLKARSLPGGGYELTFTLAARGWNGDRRMRPAWIQLQRGDKVDQWDFAPAWPVRAQADPRLNLRHEICDFARIAWDDGAGRRPEISWSIMHPVAIDVEYMKRVVAKAEEYGHVDSFELCGLEQKGINALSTFDRYPHVREKADRQFVERTRAAMNEVCDLAHRAGKPVYFWHRENLVPKGLFEDVPELLDEDGEFDLLGAAYADYLRYKIGDAFAHCPGLDGLVLTLTESEYSVLHNSNQVRYPAARVVQNIVGIFTEELGRRGKRFILRSFGDGEDHDKIIDGAVAAAKASGVAFEVETKVTEADFVPWLPKNKYLRRDPPLSLGAECDALGEFLGAGYLPAAHVRRIREYVASAREEGASRYAIRIDRKGFSIFDSAHEVNLYAYMRFIRDPSATAEEVAGEYAAMRFGRAAGAMAPVMESELELVRNVNYVASNLTFHAFPIGRDFKYVKAGGIFSLYRENAPLRDMDQIWSIMSWMTAPTHMRILAEKDLGVRLAEDGLATIEGMKGMMPEDEYVRQHRAFANAVTVSRALRGYTRCVVAYFEDMAAGADEPLRLKDASDEASRTVADLMGGALDAPYLDGIGFFCKELLREYRIERAMRRRLEVPEVYDFVVPGGIYDDGRVIRMMHAALPQTKADRVVRFAGNNRFPIGRIAVRLTAPETARIDVALDPDGAQECDVAKSWKDGVWTVSVGKKGSSYPGILSIAAVR